MVVLLTLCVAATGCGDKKKPKCDYTCATPGLQSQWGMDCDPCKQEGTSCAAVGGKGVTMCMPEGVWDMRPQPDGCFCVMPPPVNCGNALVDVGEDCDGVNLNGMSCQTMMPGGTGTLSCDANCKFNASGCMGPATPMGGMGGG